MNHDELTLLLHIEFNLYSDEVYAPKLFNPPRRRFDRILFSVVIFEISASIIFSIKLSSQHVS